MVNEKDSMDLTPVETIKGPQSGITTVRTTKTRPNKLRSLTRLFIGGLALGADELFNQMSEWEQKSSRAPAQPEYQASAFNKFEYTPTPPEMQTTIPEAETAGQLARYALFGVVIETENRIRSGLSKFNRLGNALVEAANPTLKSLSRSRAVSPTRRRYNKLVNRGEAEVSRWIALGREEETRGRQMVQFALDDTVDTSIEYLADNPEIQELIQAQSTGLATEVVEEIRERTVSADTYIEGVLRALLRRKPRSELPAPPLDIRMQALTFRTAMKDLSEASNDDEPSTG